MLIHVDVASQVGQQYSGTMIYAGFDGSDPYSTNVTPGCELQAHWPSDYGDVYLDEENCLVDSGNNVIFNQCCTNKSLASVSNPYRNPKPAATCTRDNAILYIKFRVWSKDFVNGNPSSLKKQVQGCGALTGWHQEGNTDHQKDMSANKIGNYQADYYVSFNLPTTFKSGCVGRAIASAGGPSGVDC